MIGPFMKVYGSKWSAAKAGRYPAPEYTTIYEPYAGGAGYSCAHHEMEVILSESHPELSELWTWLIGDATEAIVREIPIFEPGIDIRTTGMSRGQLLLVKWWQRTNNHGTKTFITSPWSNKPGQWTANTRARVAEQVHAIKHWEVMETFARGVRPVTVFCDPPYEFNYRYGSDGIPYMALGKELLLGEKCGCQIIACEAVGKNGETPTYLPFKPSHSQVTSRRKQTQSHHSKELIYFTGQN